MGCVTPGVTASDENGKRREPDGRVMARYAPPPQPARVSSTWESGAWAVRPGEAAMTTRAAAARTSRRTRIRTRPLEAF